MALVFGRTWGRLMSAPFRRDNYATLRMTFRVVASPRAFLFRYVFTAGGYPWDVVLKTPTGPVEVRLFSRHDIVTIAETFCRNDYTDQAPRLVVDVGANIGLVSLFFLTRRVDASAVCVEPDPVNVPRLIYNLRGFTGRYELHEVALSTVPGSLEFVQHHTGRYGALAEFSSRDGPRITVQGVTPEFLLRPLVARTRIDLLKIATEGNELGLVASIPADVRRGIGVILFKDRVSRVHVAEQSSARAERTSASELAPSVRGRACRAARAAVFGASRIE